MVNKYHMKTASNAPKKERNYGTWPLMIFVFGLIALMLILSYIKNHFF